MDTYTETNKRVFEKACELIETRLETGKFNAWKFASHREAIGIVIQFDDIDMERSNKILGMVKSENPVNLLTALEALKGKNNETDM